MYYSGDGEGVGEVSRERGVVVEGGWVAEGCGGVVAATGFGAHVSRDCEGGDGMVLRRAFCA